MATMQDLDRIALALPEVTKEVSEDGRPSYVVHGKSWFCFHRSPRRDAVDQKTGKRLTDVLVFRVDGEDLKELMLNGRARHLLHDAALERLPGGADADQRTCGASASRSSRTSSPRRG